MEKEPFIATATVEVAWNKLWVLRTALCALLMRAPANETEIHALVAEFDGVLASLEMGLEMAGAKQPSLADESPSKEAH